jgi:hypothetical protein
MLENLAFVMPVLLAYALAWVMDWSVASWPSFGGEFWLLSCWRRIGWPASASWPSSLRWWDKPSATR